MRCFVCICCVLIFVTLIRSDYITTFSCDSEEAYVQKCLTVLLKLDQLTLAIHR